MSDALTWDSLNTEEEVAKALGVARETLRGLRHKGMPYLKVGRLVYFHEPTAVRWLLEHKSVNTKEDNDA
ncbi:MAG: helix-turn-helix domain-containing protein [Lentisphaerae bacterium]|nr:helix-turn-helix domain-containing protein [Lentisphaerota bacterium]